MILWHQEPRSRKLITELAGRVERVKRIAIPADYYVFVGADRAAQRTLEALEARRTRAVERAFGACFTELTTSERRHAYLDIDAQAPSVYEVLS